MAVKSISIEQLIPGMFLVGVNVSWVDTPFIRHKFLIKDRETVAKLKASGVTQVEIDTAKGRDAAAETAAAPPAVPAPEPAPAAVAAAPAPAKAEPRQEPPREAPPPAAPSTPRSVAARIPTAPTGYEQELNRAAKIRTAARKLLNQAADSIRAGERLDESMFNSLVEHSAGSTQRNPLAMLTMLAHQPASSELIHHCFNQMGLALLLGQRLGMASGELERLGTAALLMDIGWIRLPPKLLRQRHAYTEDEYREVQQHVRHSVEILWQGGFEEEIVHLVETHHERVDGSGYPDALAGDEVPAESQILSLVNHYESCVHGLNDSAPAIPARVLRNIYARAGEGGHDGNFAKQLIALVGIYPMSSAVELDSGEKGVVTKVNWKHPMYPTVRILYGQDKRALLAPMEIDLAALKEAGTEKRVKQVLEPRKPGVDPRGLLVFSES